MLICGWKPDKSRETSPIPELMFRFPLLLSLRWLGQGEHAVEFLLWSHDWPICHHLLLPLAPMAAAAYASFPGLQTPEASAGCVPETAQTSGLGGVRVQSLMHSSALQDCTCSKLPAPAGPLALCSCAIPKSVPSPVAMQGPPVLVPELCWQRSTLLPIWPWACAISSSFFLVSHLNSGVLIAHIMFSRTKPTGRGKNSIIQLIFPL